MAETALVNPTCTCLFAENPSNFFFLNLEVAPVVDTTTMTTTTGAPRAVEATTRTTKTEQGAGATTVGG